jgi:hypothetical protein
VNTHSFNALILVALLIFSLNAMGDNVKRTARDSANKVEEVSKDAWKDTKKAYRKTKEEVCEMVKGELKCVKLKAENTALNAKDEIKDKVD